MQRGDKTVLKKKFKILTQKTGFCLPLMGASLVKTLQVESA